VVGRSDRQERHTGRILPENDERGWDRHRSNSVASRVPLDSLCFRPLKTERCWGKERTPKNGLGTHVSSLDANPLQSYAVAGD
jgi:hypothetical protein